MGKVYDAIDERLREWIGAQALFFVGTAPSEGGHVNVSPKGPIDSFRVVDERTVEYDDHVGSGAETIAHIRDDGRVCVIFCAFSGPARIVRLHGRGELAERRDPAGGVRGVVRVHVERISDSCGYGVPLMELVGTRPQRERWLASKDAEGLRDYVREKNTVSIDGLPAL
ncbi:MAG: pyridoxamine 5'-phosphate oxidase family protein [Actinobacteria bacterium]|nr:pyridoxamine 5'-phosphate oxidase family protein [Actinomycetota bacterium]